MNEEVKEALRAWNQFIRGYSDAKEGWDKFSALCGFGGVKLDQFPERAQRALSRVNPKAKFTVALPRFADHVRRYGDINAMTFIVPSTPKPKPVVEPKPEVKVEVKEEENA